MKTQGGFLITQIKQVGGRIFERILEREGISEFNGAQGKILYVLWQQDMIPASEVAKSTSLAGATLTSMLDRMEKSGLVERVSDKKDRRKVLIRLTDKARELKDRYEEVSDRMNDVYYKGFTEEEVIFFEETLARVLKNLKEEEENEQNKPRSNK